MKKERKTTNRRNGKKRKEMNGTFSAFLLFATWKCTVQRKRGRAKENECIFYDFKCQLQSKCIVNEEKKNEKQEAQMNYGRGLWIDRIAIKQNEKWENLHLCMCDKSSSLDMHTHAHTHISVQLNGWNKTFAQISTILYVHLWIYV